MDMKASEENLLGQRLRLRRTVRRASLQDIADKAGISVAQLSLIERGRAQPSLRTLRLITAALEMPMSWLFDAKDGVGECEGGIVVRRNQRRRFDLGPTGIAKELLTGDECQEIQLMMMTVPPEGGSGDQPFKTGPAARCGIVLEGRLGLEIDGQSFVLDTGDAFSFAKRESCRIWCESEEPAQVIWVAAPAVY